MTSLDILAHEFSHCITQNTASIIYQDEHGTLNENFSDIFGKEMENMAKLTIFSWVLGKKSTLSNTGIRNMQHPNLKSNLDTYLGTLWYFGTDDNDGVYTNSGIMNFWFYLLSMGGSGTNDNGNLYSVSGLGMGKAAQISIRALTTYLSSTSEYEDAREVSIQAAIDLYGSCSIEVIKPRKPGT